MSDTLRDKIAAELARHHPRVVVVKLGSGAYTLPSCRCCHPEPLQQPHYRGPGAWNLHLADALAAALHIAADCESGCMWQIPNHIEDMTDRQREFMIRAYEDTLESTAIAAMRAIDQHNARDRSHWTEGEQ